MSRPAVVAGVVACTALAGVPFAGASTLRGCDPISSYEIQRDPATTTCGLARSATRDYIRRVRAGSGASRPGSIVGSSPKTGRRYRLTLRSFRQGEAYSVATFTGRAGDARLLVRITGHVF